MRKIKSNFFISLDGVVESPDKWHFAYFNDEMGAAVDAGFATFPADEPRIPLELVSAETFKTGVLSLSYAPIKD
jgi:hypothetical protein